MYFQGCGEAAGPVVQKGEKFWSFGNHSMIKKRAKRIFRMENKLPKRLCSGRKFA